MKISIFVKVTSIVIIIACILGLGFSFLAYSFGGFCEGLCLLHLIAILTPIISISGIVFAIAMWMGKKWAKIGALLTSVVAVVCLNIFAYYAEPDHTVGLTNYLLMTLPAYIPLILVIFTFSKKKNGSEISPVA